jgi:hypothetical protein
MVEPQRSSVLTWLLIGLVVVLSLGTVGAVALPIARCPECRSPKPGLDGVPLRRIRIDGKWTVSDAPCGCCANRGRVTILTYGLSQARHRPR